MKTYVMPHMPKSLADHELTEIPGGYLMKKPDDGNFALAVVEVRRHIVLVGDLMIDGNGAVSVCGYDLGWFAQKLSEDYLCSKFLREVWQWEACKEELQWWLDQGDVEDEKDKKVFRELIAGTHESTLYEDPTAEQIYETLSTLNTHWCDDGIPGMDYPRAAAGWLCAAQQKFATLHAAREAVAAE